jgi:hypothetical protein
VPSVIWTERALKRYIVNSGIAIIAGWASGYAVSLLGINSNSQFTSLVVSMTITLFMIIILKNTSINEIRDLVEVSFKGTVRSKVID